MRVVILFALFAYCKCDYPTALPEVVPPSDSYGAPPETPADSYGPPRVPSDSYGAPVEAPIDNFVPSPAVPVKVAPVQEILPTSAPEPIVSEAVTAVPTQSASFNFLSELTAPPLVTLGVADAGLKAAPIVQQETLNAPLIDQFQLTIPGLVPPVANIPLPPVLPPVLPPSVFPPVQPPISLPLPVQPAPVQPLPLPIQQVSVQPAPLPVQSLSTQTIPLQSNPSPAPVTRVTAHEITVPRVQTTLIPPERYQFINSVAPFQYAPFFFHANNLPTSFFTSRRIFPQLATSSQAGGLLFLQPETLNAVAETSAAKTTPAIIEAPSTRYGTPILESLNKKK